MEEYFGRLGSSIKNKVKIGFQKKIEKACCATATFENSRSARLLPHRIPRFDQHFIQTRSTEEAAEPKGGGGEERPLPRDRQH